MVFIFFKVDSFACFYGITVLANSENPSVTLFRDPTEAVLTMKMHTESRL